MKIIFKVLGKDLKKIIKNPAAIIVVLGICFIPSLYAWITLKANWNPYVNTGNIPIGIINQDNGTIVDNQIVNVGDQILTQLQTNHNIGWKFTTIQQGEEGLKNGQYYALIIIPGNFSKDLATLTTANPVKPTLTYEVNDKTNIIATKITQVANQELVEQIQENFVKVVNQEVLQLANQLGEKIESNKPIIANLKSTVNNASDRLKEINNSINNSTESINDLSNYLSSMKTDLPKITNQINSLQTVVTASKSIIATTQNSVSSVADSISNSAPNIINLNDQLSGFVNQLKDINTNVGENKAQINIINNANTSANNLLLEINKNLNILESLNKTFNNSIIQDAINKLNNIKELIQNQQEKLNNLKMLLTSNKENMKQVNSNLTDIEQINSSLVLGVNSVVSSLNLDVIPTINNISSEFTQGLNNADSLLEVSKSVVPQLNSIANFGISASNMTISEANQLKSKLSKFEETINQLQDKLSKVNNENIDEIVSFLSKNPTQIASFLSSPIVVKQEQVYGDLPFGVGLIPFYTCLAIWVGSLLLTSLFTVEARNSEEIKGKVLAKHFGKLLLFMILSFIQTTIVIIGNKFVLGFNPANMWLMLGVGWVCSITFTIIIFTLVSLFGNVGKAIAIVIMVFQIAGSGAIYPIQTNPLIFRKLEFLWPFKYALDGFREAIAGPMWNMVQSDFKALSIFAVIFLILGFLKPLIHKQTEFMEHKFKESGL
ncbi:MAG: YhgE/Pip family protein [Sarcina sp.]